MTALFAAVGRLQVAFDESGETRVGTLANPYFEMLASVTEEYRGRAVSPPGEEVLAEFAEPAMGVRAAVEMQRRFLKAVESQAEESRPVLRIGLHNTSGEVAARVARQAKPGAILISRAVREALPSDVDVRCTWQGQLTDSKTSTKEDLFEVIWSDSTARATATTPVPVAKAPAPVLQRFDILGELGHGGMGIVYKARDRETGETVALKVLKPDLLESPAILERFKNEVRLARKITHKNVCRIHDFHRDDDIAYLSMEFVEGESLRAVLDRVKRFPAGDGLNLARQICAGLREAHAQGVVHRDLKPQNIMVDDASKVTLMDFGIARSVESGNTLTVGVIGTPAYMAPEQAEGKPVDHRTDIYALGLVMYEMFTGVQAFSGETMVTVVMKQIMEAPRPPRELEPSLPPGLERVILGCLSKSPDQRFPSVAALEAALANPAEIPASVQTTVVSPPPTQVIPPPVPPSPPKRKWWKTAMGITAMGCGVPVVSICLLVVFLTVWSSSHKKAKTAPTSPPAQAEPPTVEPAVAPSRKDRKKNKTAGQPPPAAATGYAGDMQIPGVNAPIPGIPTSTDIQNIVKKAQGQQVQGWIRAGDAFMQSKEYAKAVKVFEMAAAANPDDQTIKGKLAKARQAAAGNP